MESAFKSRFSSLQKQQPSAHYSHFSFFLLVSEVANTNACRAQACHIHEMIICVVDTRNCSCFLACSSVLYPAWLETHGSPGVCLSFLLSAEIGVKNKNKKALHDLLSKYPQCKPVLASTCTFVFGGEWRGLWAVGMACSACSRQLLPGSCQAPPCRNPPRVLRSSDFYQKLGIWVSV